MNTAAPGEPRTCAECGTALAADANPRRRYCSTSCRQRNGDRRRKREKYHADPAFRQRQLEYAARLRKDPEWAEQQRAAQRDRYRNDPAHRQKQLDKSRARPRKAYRRSSGEKETP